MTKAKIYAALMAFYMDMDPADDAFEDIGHALGAMILGEWFREPDSEG